MRKDFGGNLSPVPMVPMMAPRIPDDQPCYRILKPCFLAGEYCVEGEIIVWTQEPNKEMEPLNDLAHEATMAFFDNLDECGKKVAAQRNTRYVPLRRPVADDIALNTAAARRPEIKKGDGGIPVFAHEGKKKGIPSIKKLRTGLVQEQAIKEFTKREMNDATAN